MNIEGADGSPCLPIWPFSWLESDSQLEENLLVCVHLLLYRSPSLLQGETGAWAKARSWTITTPVRVPRTRTWALLSVLTTMLAGRLSWHRSMPTSIGRSRLGVGNVLVFRYTQSNWFTWSGLFLHSTSTLWVSTSLDWSLDGSLSALLYSCVRTLGSY